jgi:hypothetical protein
MVAEMNRMENAARLAMADLGTELSVRSTHYGMSFAVKFGLIIASLTMTGMVAASLI